MYLACAPACCLLPTAPVCQPHPVGLLQHANDRFSRESALLSRATEPASSSTRAQIPNATWYWRHRVDASDGESGGRAVWCDEDEHGSRAAGPSRLQSFFSHTCCPYAACVACGAGRGAVERSEERLAYLNETRMDFKVEKGCSTQRRAVKSESTVQLKTATGNPKA